jgi:Zinc-binding dehydrogenase
VAHRIEQNTVSTTSKATARGTEAPHAGVRPHPETWLAARRTHPTWLVATALGDDHTGGGFGPAIAGRVEVADSGDAVVGAEQGTLGTPHERVVPHGPTTDAANSLLRSLSGRRERRLRQFNQYQFTALVTLVSSGGIVVSTTAWMPTPSDDERSVRAATVFVRSDAEQLSQLVARVDRGELRVDVAERVPLGGLPAIHARAAAGDISGKVIVLPHGEG